MEMQTTLFHNLVSLQGHTCLWYVNLQAAIAGPGRVHVSTLPMRHPALTDSSCYLTLSHCSTHKEATTCDACNLWCTFAACSHTAKKTPLCSRYKTSLCPPEEPAETATLVSVRPAPLSCDPAMMTYLLLHTCIHPESLKSHALAQKISQQFQALRGSM